MIRIAISIRMPYRFLSPHSLLMRKRLRQEVREQQESDFDPVEVTRALTVIPSDDHDDWILVGQALHSTGQPLARGLWDWWSRRSAKYQQGDQDYRWKSFTKDGGRTLGDLYTLAHQYGWRPAGWGQEQPEAITSLKKPNYLAEKYPGFDKDSCGEEAPSGNYLVFLVQRVANACRAGSLWTRWRDCPHHFPPYGSRSCRAARPTPHILWHRQRVQCLA